MPMKEGVSSPEERMRMSDYQQDLLRDEGQPPTRTCGQAPRSAMAISSLVLGVVALLTSFIPIVNNASLFVALLGAVFGIIAVVATMRGTRKGKALAASALVLNIVSIAVVFATQAMFSAAIDEAASNLNAVETPTEQSLVDSQASQSQADYEDLEVGATAELNDGLSVRVESVESGLLNYDGKEISCVRVAYENNGSREAPFNVFDWKAQDEQGAQRNITYYSEAADDLNSGSLAPGGSVQGNLYFDGNISKVLYYSNVFFDSSVAWVAA